MMEQLQRVDLSLRRFRKKKNDVLIEKKRIALAVGRCIQWRPQITTHHNYQNTFKAITTTMESD
jgi:hypothetical protein